MNNPPVIGIHDLAVATGARVLDLADLAHATGVEPAKFHKGLGQDHMSVPAPDEDIVTMGADAAAPILERHGTDGIRTLLFATESGVDQSKAAGVFAHRLLGLPSACRVVELKQACYGGTAALQMAMGIVARDPRERVLIITSDVARYGIDTAAEPTQGAGAVAMLVAADPDLLEIPEPTGVWTADIDDFWRPNDSDVAMVEGKLSIDAYLDAFTGAWDDYRAQGGVDISEIDRFCHHQPFTRMAEKAHRRLGEHTGVDLGLESFLPSTRYNRRIGNSYTASLFFALAAVLDADEDLTGARIGLFSYGSGAVGEFFTAVVQPGYRELMRRDRTEKLLDARVPISVEDYRALHRSVPRDTTADLTVAPESPGGFHFAGIAGRARRYTRD
ncbi:hydroxymethylglutaryl-CoA synthase [Microbacterium xanthum]|uniref:hydroxymethylglutaryl-CoA synthase n=1 Tax=Microbacterium xanthum TaxID=3079794 RepID=UPI002AD28F5E|nr:hydroxymethylglutaryl-CoA synthase [Microbacterium sp. KSW-48]MDZ8172740.1 hydroxymethylglutaryl-CoA synthase [Microbacterium sp. KSW-48]